MKNLASLQFLVPNRRNPEQFELLIRDWEQMRGGFLSESEGREREEQLIVTEEREWRCCLGIGTLRSRRRDKERLCIKCLVYICCGDYEANMKRREFGLKSQQLNASQRPPLSCSRSQ